MIRYDPIEENNNLLDMLDYAITFLSPREADIIRKRIIEEKTLVEVSKEYHVSPERIRQIQFKALRKLKTKLLVTIIRHPTHGS